MSDKPEKSETATVEVPEAVQETTKPEQPTLAELAKTGLTQQEIAMAEKLGLAKKEGKDAGSQKDKDRNPGSDKPGRDTEVLNEPGVESKKGGEQDGKEKEEERHKADGRILIDGKTPEQVLQDQSIDLNPEQEKTLKAVLNSNAWGLYRAQKRERQRRQSAESEKETLAKQNEDLKRQLEIATKKPKVVEDELALDPDNDPEIDPDNKPLTKADLDRIEKEKQEKADADAKARNDRASVVKEVLDDQQEEARDRYEDFDTQLEATGEILRAATAGNLAELFPDARERSKVETEVRLLLTSFAQADKFEPGEYNAADRAYDLGKRFKVTKQPANANGSKRGETDVDGNPEKATRALQNANRRGSSAALNGGGSRRAVNLDELTPEQAVRLPDSQFRKLPKETRNRLLRQ